MKKIINGKKYDTETATRVGYWDSDYSRNDFNWYEEILFRKRTGEYFLYGNGNAMSPYCRSVDYNTWCEGERITPMSESSAREWAENKLSCEEFEEIFGEVEE